MSESQPCVTFPALGSTAVVATREADRLEAARLAVEEVVEQFDRTCSRFREDSELSALNAAAGSPIEVSPLLFDAVQAALRAATVTDGDVDPTVGEALIALGYDRDFDELPDQARAGRPRIAAVPGWRAIAIDPDRRTIRLPRGVKIDLGATAKALASDRAAAAAHARVGCGVLVGLGGDMAIAGEPPARGWRVRVTDDHRAGVDAPGQWIALHSGLATSSTTTRRWKVEGGSAHHLLDPRTGAPVQSAWRTVSVSARNCLEANIASTAAIVRGERAVPWLESLALPSRLVRVEGTVVHLAGWPGDGDDLAPAGVPATSEAPADPPAEVPA